ncbi:MAG: hypothetical protein H0S79_21575 [Anaerolineaceae bacterium]|nr:hypothetical protein [Anaerolineaceae bacterium]
MTDKPTQETKQEQNNEQVSLPQNGEDLNGQTGYSMGRLRIGLAMTVFGYLMFLLGARPSLFNLDRSRVIGFVQISVFLVGLGIIVLGSYITLNTFWSGTKKTIIADIGSRVMSTGYVICVFTAMADIFGLGSHRLPNVFFGPLQARGVAIGMATIGIGLLMLIRLRHPGEKRSEPTPKKEAGSAKKSSKKQPKTVQAA